MKKAWKNILTTILFIGILIALLWILSVIFQPRNNTSAEGIQDEQANGILAEPENTIDAVILGDSETYCGYIPLELWRTYGITTYVCGTTQQKMYYTCDFLRKTFETQRPKVVFLETNAFFRDYGYAQIITNTLEDKLPIFRYHDRWKTIQTQDLIDDVEYTNIERDKGYHYYAKADPADTNGYMQENSGKISIPKKNLRYIREIQKYCEENDARLVLISTPSTKNWNYKKHNSVEELAKELGVEYIDLNLQSDQVAIDWNTDSRDKGDHLNYNGAMKVTDYVGKYLKETELFEDKRENPDYADWNTQLEAFDQYKAEQQEQ